MEVEIEGLTRDFGSTRAVDGLSFRLRGGETYGFVGPNGAGKTTTMRILATLDEPTAGDAWIDGRSVVERPEWARRRVGFMPDALPAHRDVTVREYLDFFARAYGLRGRERREMLVQVEGFAGLAALNHKLLKSLSKGMKQRVSLARALVHDPPFLVLDEPAAGLDPRARVELRELLGALGEKGKAVLVSSHILTELAEICDGAVIIEKGRLVRAGPLGELRRESAAGEEAAGRRVVAVRSQGELDGLRRALLEMPPVSRAEANGTFVEAEVDGGDDACCELLRALVENGHRVLEFKPLGHDLERIFISATDGELQ